MDQRLVRWTHASVAKYVKDAVGSQAETLCEGLEERTQDFHSAAQRVEIRFNGPYFKKRQGMTEVACSVNALVTSQMGDKQNVYAHNDLLGLLASAIEDGIPLFQTGSAADSGIQIGCFAVLSEVKVFHFGQLDPVSRIRQGLVTAALYLEL
jgi:hypothetical protein